MQLKSLFSLVFAINAILLLIGCSENKPVDQATEIQKDTNMVYIEPKNFMDFEYSKVIAFATVYPCDYYELYFSKKMDLSKFHDTISKTLDSTQIHFLNQILSGYYREPYKKGGSFEMAADCFYPRHNIIFLNNQDTLVHFISVCFECSKVKQSKDDLASMDNFKLFFDSIGLPAIENPDLYKHYYDSQNSQKGHRVKK
jgi:hypothetical protein